MEFNVVFNILKINKVHRSTWANSVVEKQAPALISGCTLCVGRVCQQCWSLYFLVFAYPYCVPKAKKRCDKEFCQGLLQIYMQREKEEEEKRVRRKMGLRETKEIFQLEWCIHPLISLLFRFPPSRLFRSQFLCCASSHCSFILKYNWRYIHSTS